MTPPKQPRPVCPTCELSVDELGQCEVCRSFPVLVAAFAEGEARLVAAEVGT